MLKSRKKMLKMTLIGVSRAKPGSVKARLAAMRMGDSFACTETLERNKYYSIARRMGIRLSSGNGLMRRVG